MKSKNLSPPNLLKFLQSYVWYNLRYKMFFSKRHTNNPQEYYWFILDVPSGHRLHGHYRVTTDNIIVNFMKQTYKVKYLDNMRRYDIILIQLVNIDNELDYKNFMGEDIPDTTGAPYTITKLQPTI